MMGDEIQEMPWAEWMEETLGYILSSKPRAIGICIISDADEAATGYWNTSGPWDKCMMACHMHADGMLEMILNNAGEIAREIEQLSDEEDS